MPTYVSDGGSFTYVSGTNSWTNTANIFDTSTTTFGSLTTTTSGIHSFDIGSYGLSIPAGESLTSVTVRVYQYVSGTSAAARWNNPTIEVYDGATLLFTSGLLTESTSSSNFDDVTVTGVTVSNLNSANFKIRFLGSKNGTQSATQNVGMMEVTVVTSSGVTAGASVVAQTVTLSTTGVIGFVQGASLTGTVTASADDVLGLTGEAPLAATVTASSGGFVSVVRYTDITERPVFKLGPNPSAAFTGGTSTLTETVTATVTGATGVATGGSLSSTTVLSAAGATGVAADGSLSQTVTLSATGVADVTGSATLTGTVSLSASGTVAGFGDATLSGTVSITSTGSAAIEQGGSLSPSVTVTGDGAVGLSSQSTLAVMTDTSSGGFTELASGADFTVSTVIESTGSVVTSGDSSLAETVTITADGSLVRVGLATSEVTVTVNATGSVSRQLTAQLSVAVGTAAAGIRQGYLLKQPTTEQVYTNILPFARFGIDTGQTIILKNGVITVTDYPYQDELDDADAYYLGGHVYSLTQAEAQALIAAGGSQYVEEL